jgi:hypothetical protein
MADPPQRPEAAAEPVADASSPAARVRAALASLGLDAPGASAAAAVAAAAGGGVRRPSIMDYHSAYLAGGRGRGVMPGPGRG